MTVFGRKKRKHGQEPAVEDEAAGDAAADASGRDADAADTTHGRPSPGDDADPAPEVGQAAEGAAAEDAEPAAADEAPEEQQDRSEGPFDESEVEGLDELAAQSRVLDLGSVLVPVPDGGQVQVELAGSGSVNGVFVTIGGGRVTMAAFAAPKSPGQWRSVIGELAESVRGDGAKASVRQGPWGRELHAASDNGDVRFIGVDGPRWMLRGVAIGQKGAVGDDSDLTLIAREMISGTVVRRGDDPMPVRSPLSVTLPKALAEQLAQAQQQQQAQNQSRQQQEALQQLRRRQQEMSASLQQGAAGQEQGRRNPDGSAMQQFRNGSSSG